MNLDADVSSFTPVSMRGLMLLLFVACGGKSDPPPAPSPGSGSGTGSAADARLAPPYDAVSKSSPIEGDPAYAVVERAFHQRKPAFPLLSKDGNVAAVEIATPIGKSGGSSYSVGFITAGADAWSGGIEPELITLVDAKLVHLLLESMDTKTVSTFDIESITKLATSIKERLAADGFTRLASQLDEIRDGTYGGFVLKLTTEPTTHVLTIDAAGTSVQIQPVPMGRVGDLDCVAYPEVARGWVDAARRRLLLHVGWKADADQCDLPDAHYRLFTR